LATLVALLGFVLAAVFGVVANRVNFCTMGAVSDVVNMGDWARARMWLLAIACAIVGVNLLSLLGHVDVSRSIYTGERFPWLSYLSGGFLFGIGMTLASGCGMRNLVRLGSGNLKSVVVLVFLGLSAYMTMKGVLAQLRVGLIDRPVLHFDGGQSLYTLIARASNIDVRALQWVVMLVSAAGLLAFVFRDARFRASRDLVLGGLTIGAIIAAGWYVTGHVGHLAEDPQTLEEVWVGTNTKRPESFSYVAPLGYSLELLMLWTDKSLKVTFGIAIVIGLLVGSLAYALVTRRFRIESFTSAADFGNHLVGAILMGFGGVTAMGCTVGQGLSGISTLALGSVLALASIVAGSAATMKWLYWRMA
jgi:uncharacterized membrane protein YedE/YeeE